MTKAHCNTCGGDRNHTILHTESALWSDDENGISGRDLYEMLRCNGCDDIKLRHTSRFSGDDGPTITYFPPSIFRPKPAWLNILWFQQAEGLVVQELLSEVYSALQNNQPRLAAMGVRATLEQIMVSRVGDQRSFAKNLAEFEAKGFVSPVQRERLEAILEAGHASIHRSYKPSQADLVTLVDLTEHIVESVYLHESAVALLKNRVPPRS
jgi:hypothetical protein